MSEKKSGDYYKKKSEQREIVMMQMYDMYNSLQMVEQADQTIYQLMELQCKIAEDTMLYEQERYRVINMIPLIEYTKSVESVFNSTIETILTIGNVILTKMMARRDSSGWDLSRLSLFGRGVAMC